MSGTRRLDGWRRSGATAAMDATQGSAELESQYATYNSRTAC